MKQELMVTVSGPAKSGKTRLIKLLRAALPPEFWWTNFKEHTVRKDYSDNNPKWRGVQQCDGPNLVVKA